MASVDWKKLGIYAAVVGAVVLTVHYRHARPPVEHEQVDQGEACCKADTPVVAPEKPTIVVPPAEKPKPAVKKATKQVHKSKSRFTPRPVNTSPGCRAVPYAAYQHPLDVIVAIARRQHISPEDIDILERCWRGEAV